MDENEKGYVTLLLVILIAFGFLLSGGLMPLLQQPPANATGYSLINPPVSSSSSTLQLQSLTLVANAVTAACDPDPEHRLNSGEPYILYAAEPAFNGVAATADTIKLWYIDEHALTLGENPGVVAMTPNQPQANPNVGDQMKRDTLNLPIFPALFVTDITSNPANTSGDAQNGGTPIPPSMVSGTWKAANTNDPAKNYPNGGLIDPLPSQSNIGHDISGNRDRDKLYYSAEIEWNVSDLINKGVLKTGETYRAQFVIHDGDNNTNGGDIGLGCTTIDLAED
jgi:hypothetical protein